MKKLILSIFSLFFITGCYDNIDLNDLNIITGIGVEYIDNEYKVTYEILNSEKSSDSISMHSFTESGKGKTISNAFDNANRYISKKPYFSHLKILVLDTNVEDDKLRELFEYLIRRTDIRDEFHILVTKDKPSDILKANNKENPVVSLELYDMLANSKYGSNLAITTPFEKLFSSAKSDLSDMAISTIELKNKKIKLLGATTYNQYNVKRTLSKKETSLFNILNNNCTDAVFNKKYKNNELISITLYDSNLNIKITNNKIKITGTLEGLLLDNTTDLSVEKFDDLNKINKDFKNIIEKDIKKFIKELQKDKTDILKLSDKYYKKYRKQNNKIWQYLDVETDIKVKINKKGLIFEV